MTATVSTHDAHGLRPLQAATTGTCAKVGDSSGSGGGATAAPDEVSRRLSEARKAGQEAWRQAQADVIVDHVWLARAVANRYRRRGEDQDDLFQVACLGLVQAVRRFDPDHGDFLAFAGPTIAGVVKRHFRDHGWLVRPPRRTQEAVADVRREWSDLAQELRREPSDRELAERLGYAVSDVTEARCASQGYSSAALESIGQRQTWDVADDQEFHRTEARLVVERAVCQLNEESRRLVWMRFYEGRTQSDIAIELGTSQMQISRRLTRVCGELRGIVGTMAS